MIAVHLENGRVSIRHRPRPRRPEGWAMIRLLREGKIRVDEMIAARLPLAEAARAFQRAGSGALKVLLIN